MQNNGVPWLLRGLKIWHRHCCGVVGSLAWEILPATSTAKKKKKKKKKKKNPKKNQQISFFKKKKTKNKNRKKKKKKFQDKFTNAVFVKYTKATIIKLVMEFLWE